MIESGYNWPHFGLPRIDADDIPPDAQNAAGRPQKQPKQGRGDTPLLPIDQIDEELEQLMYHRDVPIYKDADGMYVILVHNDSGAKHPKTKTIKTHHLSSIKRLIGAALQNDDGRFRYMNRGYILAL